jgi:hypothetical protein
MRQACLYVGVLESAISWFQPRLAFDPGQNIGIPFFGTILL